MNSRDFFKSVWYTFLFTVVFFFVVVYIYLAKAQEGPSVDTCHTEAEQYVSSVWHLESRLKVPMWAALGTLFGRPGWMAVLAANAESPRARWMYNDYMLWCINGKKGVLPKRSPLLELF